MLQLLVSDVGLRLVELGITAIALLAMIAVHYFTIHDLRADMRSLRRLLVQLIVESKNKE